MPRKSKKKCPLKCHYAAGTSACIGCGKSFHKSPKQNPPKTKAKRIGRVRAVLYDRDQGKYRGLYRHDFRSTKAGVWTESNGKVSIR